jgi:hypothetical protein
MSHDERALLVEMLEGSRDRLRAAIEAAPEDCWKRKPAGGGWSAAECAEHLLLCEETLLGLIRGQILAGPANPDAAAELKGKDGIVVQAMHDRSMHIKTFPFLEPTGQWADRRGALDEFLARRASTVQYAAGAIEPMHHHAAPLGELGLLDAYQWLLLMAAHTDRHLAQMEEALGEGS